MHCGQSIVQTWELGFIVIIGPGHDGCFLFCFRFCCLLIVIISRGHSGLFLMLNEHGSVGISKIKSAALESYSTDSKLKKNEDHTCSSCHAMGKRYSLTW